MFTHMTVRDEGDALAVRYGPLALFGGRFRYPDLTDVEPSRSSVVDGWGNIGSPTADGPTTCGAFSVSK